MHIGTKDDSLVYVVPHSEVVSQRELKIRKHFVSSFNFYSSLSVSVLSQCLVGLHT